MESLNILHLSDLHIGHFRYETPEPLAIKIADTLSDQVRKVDVIIFSGDIFDGRSTDVDGDRKIALLFFNTLINQLNIKELSINLLTPDDVLFVPGNHDLVRRDANQYQKYDSFIKEFYPNGKSNKLIITDSYNFICDFPQKKIAILGFNSCRIEIEKVKSNELKWIDELDLSSFSGAEDAIKNAIKAYKEKQTNWDDFGYIDPIEMDNLFNTLKQKITAYTDYNFIATFHHHFYPFPEILKTTPDASFIRNYPDVMDKFQRFKVKLVLHGHKHLSIQRAITDNKYFENPDSVIYVLSAGSIGSKDVRNPSFQWMKIFDKNYTKLAQGEKYDFKDQELDNIKPFVLPPQGATERGMSTSLIDALQIEDNKLYIDYKKITDDFEQVILDSEINKTIDIIGGLFTMFNDIKIELRKNPTLIYILLISLNYRVIYLKNHYKPNIELQELISRLKEALNKVFNMSVYGKNLIGFLSSVSNHDIDIYYYLIIKNVSSGDKRIGAYSSIGLFLTDLFLNIREYGEFYFDKEKLNHKINIHLQPNSFYKNIPSDSISIEGNIDRRAIIMNFKSKDPTVHKVAVLIIKDFEMRLDKFEDSLKEIKLKLYYIIPKIQANNYDLENFHFDAYIPTLLPLLTGDNLYKSKEVFIRELVQNSIDATLLRKKIQPDVEISTDIRIELGKEYRNGKNVKYFRIIDNGIGMSRFTIERYFTSIGRSFYVSEEFDELKKDNKIQYEAISNFGIGFLSSFMVCREVLVHTKNILNEDGTNGLEIEIPNYDGCFFIRKLDINHYGTDIILYEDERELFDFDRFSEYIKKTLIGLPVAINIEFKDLPSKSFKVDPFKFQKSLLRNMQIGKDLIFFIPFSETSKEIKNQSWKELQELNDDELAKFGIWLNFSKIRGVRFHGSRETFMCANQGLKVTTPFLPLNLRNQEFLPEITINYPSSFIQLDVAREKILALKKDIDLSGINQAVHDQFLEFLTSSSLKLNKTFLSTAHIINYVISNEIGIETYKTIRPELFTLKMIKNSQGIQLSLCKIKDLPEIHSNLEVCYWDLTNEENFLAIVEFLESIPIHLNQQITKNSSIFYDELKAFTKKHKLERIFDNFKRFEMREHTSFNFSKHFGSLNKLPKTIQKDIPRLVKNLQINEMEQTIELKLIQSLQEVEYGNFLKLFIPYLLDVYMSNKREWRRDFLFYVLQLLKSIIFNKVTVEDYKLFNLFINFSDLGVFQQEELLFKPGE